MYVAGTKDNRHVQSLLIDMGIARKRVHSSGGKKASDEQLYDAVIGQSPSFMPIAKSDTPEPTFAQMFEEHFKKAFTQTQMGPFGEIQLATQGHNADVKLGSTSVGKTVDGRLRILQVQPGAYKITLASTDNCTSVVKDIWVQPGQTLGVVMQPTCTSKGALSPWVWVGIGLGVVLAGTATAFALAPSDDGRPTYSVRFQ